MAPTDQPIEQVITERIQAALPGATVELEDLTGTRDHWEAVIVAAGFEGLNRVARQRAIYKALGELMHGPIHALTLTTLTPEQAKDR
ncbi:MAG: BolA family transcriptional regulator [Myxococcales bacterium]|nr:BolA family transcriptional regulator [Myxococcales bacterium]